MATPAFALQAPNRTPGTAFHLLNPNTLHTTHVAVDRVQHDFNHLLACTLKGTLDATLVAAGSRRAGGRDRQGRAAGVRALVESVAAGR